MYTSQRTLVSLRHFECHRNLLILRGESKSYSSTASCVPGSMFYYLKNFHSGFLHFDTLQIKYNSQTLPCKQKQRCG